MGVPSYFIADIMRFLALLATLLLAAVLCAKKKCKKETGLKCNTYETLEPGAVYNIASKKCKKGKYPKHDYCFWKFTINGCTPVVHCDYIDIKGKGKRCRGDSLGISTMSWGRSLCGKKKDLTIYPDSDYWNYYDMEYLLITFGSDKKKEGKGFQCQVFCEEPGETPVPITNTPSGECECGVANRIGRIVGGVETEANEYPWQVGIAVPKSDQPFCGGSIVSDRTIVTAAHCTEPLGAFFMEVIVGDHDITVDDGEERVKVCGKLKRPDYDRVSRDNDIAILTLCKPLTFNATVGPVCLPQMSGPAYDSVLATVSGWGALASGGNWSDTLMEVNVTTMDNTDCQAFYAGKNAVITDNMICASATGKDACQGDSGGPLITMESALSASFYSLIGVVSWGSGCAEPSFPGVYSRVTENIAFINNNMKGSTCKEPGSSAPTGTTAVTGETPVPITTTTSSPAATGETPVEMTTTTPRPAPGTTGPSAH